MPNAVAFLFSSRRDFHSTVGRHFQCRLQKPKAKKKKAIVILQLDIVAPSTELAKSGDCYITLRRKIELPFVPFIGLRLHLDPQVSIEQESRYLELFQLIASKMQTFDVERVSYIVDRPKFVVYARNLFEPTVEQSHALQEYLISFYGFRRL